MSGRILAIDPGFRATGWVVVDVAGTRIEFVDCGVVRTEKAKGKVLVSEDDWACCRQLASELVAVTDRYEPTCLVVETPQGSKSARAIKSMAYAYAVCASLAGVVRLPAVLVSAGAAKKAATGRKNASKAAVAEAIGFLPADALAEVRPASKREHVYDAAALVLGAWESEVVRMVRSR
jgi:crossover junction endodeoxyribonuclease RuvC